MAEFKDDISPECMICYDSEHLNKYELGPIVKMPNISDNKEKMAFHFSCGLSCPEIKLQDRRLLSPEVRQIFDDILFGKQTNPDQQEKLSLLFDQFDVQNERCPQCSKQRIMVKCRQCERFNELCFECAVKKNYQFLYYHECDGRSAQTVRSVFCSDHGVKVSSPTKLRYIFNYLQDIASPQEIKEFVLKGYDRRKIIESVQKYLKDGKVTFVFKTYSSDVTTNPSQEQLWNEAQLLSNISQNLNNQTPFFRTELIEQNNSPQIKNEPNLENATDLYSVFENTEKTNGINLCSICGHPADCSCSYKNCSVSYCLTCHDAFEESWLCPQHRTVGNSEKKCVFCSQKSPYHSFVNDKDNYKHDICLAAENRHDHVTGGKCELCASPYGTKIRCVDQECKREFHPTCAWKNGFNIHRFKNSSQNSIDVKSEIGILCSSHTIIKLFPRPNQTIKTPNIDKFPVSKLEIQSFSIDEIELHFKKTNKSMKITPTPFKMIPQNSTIQCTFSMKKINFNCAIPFSNDSIKETAINVLKNCRRSIHLFQLDSLHPDVKNLLAQLSSKQMILVDHENQSFASFFFGPSDLLMNLIQLIESDIKENNAAASEGSCIWIDKSFDFKIEPTPSILPNDSPQKLPSNYHKTEQGLYSTAEKRIRSNSFSDEENKEKEQNNKRPRQQPFYSRRITTIDELCVELEDLQQKLIKKCNIPPLTPEEHVCLKLCNHHIAAQYWKHRIFTVNLSEIGATIHAYFKKKFDLLQFSRKKKYDRKLKKFIAAFGFTIDEDIIKIPDNIISQIF